MTHYDPIVIICGIAHDNLHMCTTGKQNNMNSRPPKWQKAFHLKTFSLQIQRKRNIFLYILPQDLLILVRNLLFHNKFNQFNSSQQLVPKIFVNYILPFHFPLQVSKILKHEHVSRIIWRNLRLSMGDSSWSAKWLC